MLFYFSALQLLLPTPSPSLYYSISQLFHHFTTLLNSVLKNPFSYFPVYSFSALQPLRPKTSPLYILSPILLLRPSTATHYQKYIHHHTTSPPFYSSTHVTSKLLSFIFLDSASLPYNYSALQLPCPLTTPPYNYPALQLHRPTTTLPFNYSALQLPCPLTTPSNNYPALQLLRHTSTLPFNCSAIQFLRPITTTLLV